MTRHSARLSWDYRSKSLHLHGKICLEYSCYWGLLVWLTVSVLNPLITSSVNRIDPAAGETVLTAVLGLALAAALLTVAAWVRTRQRLTVLEAHADGRAVTVRETVADASSIGWHRTPDDQHLPAHQAGTRADGADRPAIDDGHRT